MATLQYCAGIVINVLMVDSGAIHVNKLPLLTLHTPQHIVLLFKPMCLSFFNQWLLNPHHPSPSSEEMVQPLPSDVEVHTHCSLWLEKSKLDGWIHTHTHIYIYIYTQKVEQKEKSKNMVPTGLINQAVYLCTYLTNGMTLKKWLASIPMAFLVVWSFLDVGRASTGYHLYSWRPNQQLNQQASYTPEDPTNSWTSRPVILLRTKPTAEPQASYTPEDQTNSWTTGQLYSWRPNQQLNQQASYTPEDQTNSWTSRPVILLKTKPTAEPQASYTPEDQTKCWTTGQLYSWRSNQQLNQQASYTPEDQQLNQQASYTPEDQAGQLYSWRPNQQLNQQASYVPEDQTNSWTSRPVILLKTKPTAEPAGHSYTPEDQTNSWTSRSVILLKTNQQLNQQASYTPEDKPTAEPAGQLYIYIYMKTKPTAEPAGHS